MYKVAKWRRSWPGIVLMLLIFCASEARAAVVQLVAYVTVSISDETNASLADGSIVYIIGSLDGTADGMVPYGDGYIGNSTQGDDVVIGMARIDSTLLGAGTFGIVIDDAFDTDDIQFLYIRFFNYQDDAPPEGSLYYGFSSPVNYTTNFGSLVEIDFGSGLKTDTQENFYAIPEPGTLHMVLLALGVLIGIHTVKRNHRWVGGNR